MLILLWTCLKRIGLLPGQGVDVEGDEEPVEQVVRQDHVEVLNVQAEDVVEVVQMVQVLRHQVF